MIKDKSVTIIVPAYNEERNIEAAIKGLEREVKKVAHDYEILIVNDGSTDATGEIARKLAKNNKRISIITHKKNKGFGYTFLDGVRQAKKKYITQFHGDNDASPTCVTDLIRNIGKADVIVNYPADSTRRTLARLVVSKVFVIVMNLLFGLHLKYINGGFICKTKLLKQFTLRSKGFAIYAEAKIRLAKGGYSLHEIPFSHTGRKTGESKAVNMRSVKNTIETIIHLMHDIYFPRIIHS